MNKDMQYVAVDEKYSYAIDDSKIKTDSVIYIHYVSETGTGGTDEVHTLNGSMIHHYLMASYIKLLSGEK